MNAKLKLAAYAVLLLLAAWFGWGFYASYSSVTRESAETPASAPDPATNIAGRSGIDTSNAAAAPTNPASGATPSAPAAHSQQGKMIGYLAAFVGAMVGLGLLVAADVTQYFAGVAVDALLDDRGEGLRDPEYEKAEQAWADGKFLEAIQMMRDFLKTHPREQYAALRIAEIYEKDLHNLVAAVLEYEELLKKKLPPERWGWAAVHLCNLYSKLGQQDKTRDLLQSIIDKYPKTAAAKKARSRLGLPEPEPESKPAENAQTAGEAGEDAGIDEEEPPAPSPAPAPPPLSKPQLPPGFRPKE